MNVTLDGKDVTTSAEAEPVMTPADAPPSRSLKRTAAGIKDSATASLTAKVLAEEERKAKIRKLDPNNNLKSLFSSSVDQTQKVRNGDFMTRGFSIPAGAKHS